MKIQNVRPQSNVSSGTPAAANRPSGVTGVTFQRTLSTLSEQARDAHYSEMVEKIDEQGRRLKTNVNIAEFARYRSLIKEFLNDLVSNGYEFEKNNSFDNRGRHRFIVTVKTVDEKLDELGKEILNEQADNISILHAIDDIRGLIVDLMS